MLSRFQNWDVRLSEFLDQRRDMPFRWGENDCALMACDAVLAMTGVDIAAEFRGTYGNVGAAVKAIRAATDGGDIENLAEQMAAKHGVDEVKVAFAQRGDVVLLDGARGKTLCIVSLDGRYAIGPGVERMEHFPVRDCRRAWRV